MLRSLTIKGFRCFRELTVKSLERVNLVAGTNNAGKTALLEAIHLHSHPDDIELPVRMDRTRGITDPHTAYADVASWLFWERRVADGFQTVTEDDQGITRTVTLWLVDAATTRERLPEAEERLRTGFRPGIVDEKLPRVVLKYEQSNEPTRISVGVVQEGTIASISARLTPGASSTYLGSSFESLAWDVRYFGELEAAKRQDEIVSVLRIVEPRLQRLSLIPFAGQPIIHGDIGLRRLVPIPFLGEGMRRLLSVVLAIANTRGGLVLIDEIENGLHYSVQKQVWQALAHAARQADVQVFATTHSWECIRWAHEAFVQDSVYDLRLHRLDRTDDQTSAVSYDREMIETALHSGIEMR